jgi:hypothetical protein
MEKNKIVHAYRFLDTEKRNFTQEKNDLYANLAKYSAVGRNIWEAVDLDRDNDSTRYDRLNAKKKEDASCPA